MTECVSPVEVMSDTDTDDGLLQ